MKVLINRYRKGVSFFKAIFEDFIFLLIWLKNKLVYPRQNRNVLFYPEFPSKRTILFKVLRKGGFNITNNPKIACRFGIYWENTTHKNPNVVFPKNLLVLNSQIQDIGKDAIDLVHHQVFDYGLNVNPKTHVGKMVEKSIANAMHDGKVLLGPIEQSNALAVYQILINNQANTTEVLDLRIPVICGKIPFAYKKYRPIETRFSNTNARAELVDKSAVISADEEAKILAFCRKQGVDYAELDVLRDNDTQKLYVVDVNPTPWGPPNHLDYYAKGKAINLLITELSFIA